jgi:hypothetical protein
MAIDRTLLYAGPVTSIAIGGTTFYNTLGGVTISFETEWLDIECDQSPGFLLKRKIRHNIFIEFVLPELNYNGALASLCQPDANWSSGLKILSISNDKRPQLQCDIIWTSASGRVHAFGGLVEFVGNSELILNKGQQSGWKVKLQVVYNTSSSKYGSFTFS